jgi:hypothetical protein
VESQKRKLWDLKIKLLKILNKNLKRKVRIIIKRVVEREMRKLLILIRKP